MAAPAASALPAARRRAVRPNFATEETRRIEAAVAARDVRALETVYRRDVEIVDHPHGVTYGYEAIVERLRSMIEDATDAALVHETLATLRRRARALPPAQHGERLDRVRHPGRRDRGAVPRW